MGGDARGVHVPGLAHDDDAVGVVGGDARGGDLCHGLARDGEVLVPAHGDPGRGPVRGARRDGVQEACCRWLMILFCECDKRLQPLAVFCVLSRRGCWCGRTCQSANLLVFAKKAWNGRGNLFVY